MATDADIQTYLSTKGVTDLFQKLFEEVVHEMPSNPAEFLHNLLDKMLKETSPMPQLSAFPKTKPPKNDDDDAVSDIFDTESVASKKAPRKMIVPPTATNLHKSGILPKRPSTATSTANARDPKKAFDSKSEIGSIMSKASQRTTSKRQPIFQEIDPSTLNDDDDEPEMDACIPPEDLARLNKSVNAPALVVKRESLSTPTASVTVAKADIESDPDNQSDDDCLELAEDLTELSGELGFSSAKHVHKGVVVRPSSSVCSKCSSKLDEGKNAAFHSALAEKENIIFRPSTIPNAGLFANGKARHDESSDDDDVSVVAPKKRGNMLNTTS